MPGVLSVVVVYNKSNQFGLAKDAQLLAEALPIAGRATGGQRVGVVKLMDCREAPIVCDVCIHLEVPYAVWFPWAKTNAILVNGEWWKTEWNCYKDQFDVAMFRDPATKEALSEGFRDSVLMKWVSTVAKEGSKEKTAAAKHKPKTREWVWVLGGSKNKRAAALKILPLWKESYPALHVYTVEALEGTFAPNVHMHTGFLAAEKKQQILDSTGGHICLSEAESFGYTAAEAEEVGAYMLLNPLPCYSYTYQLTKGVSWIDLENPDLDAAMKAFQEADLDRIREMRNALVQERRSVFLLHCGTLIQHLKEAMETRTPLPRHMPPLLNAQDCPPISIVTLSYNRPKFMQNACLNLLHSDYPRDKIEWVVVDDSDPDQSASDTVVRFTQQFSPGKVIYVPLRNKTTVGAKRNLGVERASNDIILMMDDDDHYPTTSFRRRVAWLLKARDRYECAMCTTIAMYDLLKGVSAVNVPPYDLSLAQRCSEATLTFTRSFWNVRKFPEVDVAEGEEFLKGRESQCAEIPPQQIIVALSHGKNLGSRQMPNAGNGCFWGFPRPLLEFLHGLVGIKVEEEK